MNSTFKLDTTDHTVMLEHWTDFESYHDEEAYQLFENIAKKIRKIKGRNLTIHWVILIQSIEAKTSWFLSS